MTTATQLAPRQETLPTTEPGKPDPLTMLGHAIERGMSVADLGPLMDLIERDQANKARAAFMDAMSRFQASCPTIKKSRKADRYTYAPLDEVLRTIRPHLDACGLAVRFSTRMDGPVITALCTVSHRDGHSETSEFAAPVDSNMKVNDTQKAGSANSYAKRYALMNALNLVASDEDDDGYTAGSADPMADPATMKMLDAKAKGHAEREKFLGKHREHMKQSEADRVLKMWTLKDEQDG